METLSKEKIKEVIDLAGNEGKYQKWLIVLFSLLWIEINFFLVGPSYIYMNPSFQCRGIKHPKVLQETACVILQKCTLIDHFTITSDLHLYCDKKFDRQFTQIVFSMGAFLGLIIINLLSDIKSRKYSAILALACANFAGVCAFLGGTYESISLLVVSQFLGGFGAFSLVPLTYTFFSDLCSDIYRQKGVVFVNSAWGLSTALLGVMYLFQTHWSTYLLYYLIVPFFVISVLITFFLIESPYVQIYRKQPKQALQTLVSLCKFNDREENIPKIEGIFKGQHLQQKEDKQYPTVTKIFKIIRQGKFLGPIIILMIVNTMATLNLYAVSFALQIQGLGYGINSIIAGVIQLTSFLYLNLVIHKIPRRCGMAGFYAVVSLLGLTFLIPFIKHNLLLKSLVMGLSRFASTIAYTLLSCMQTEAFTVEIQSTAAALIQTFGVFGILFGPLVVTLAESIGMDPIVLISLILNLAIWPSFCLPQTLRNKSRNEINSHLETQRLVLRQKRSSKQNDRI